jgi:hypothetical protein
MAKTDDERTSFLVCGFKASIDTPAPGQEMERNELLTYKYRNTKIFKSTMPHMAYRVNAVSA